ncbi:MAG: UvrB/UvrC motif-containing protein [Verrucomicrobia bacterium]|nr:UvrB/UvrC motif-containing protein [Verrucomicrobiota bacterium]
MKCDMCDKEASVFLTQIVEGKMTQANLCEQCSKEKGVTDPTGFQLADFLIGAASQGKTKHETAEDDALACPACGFTRAHLKKIGRLGCPECYQTFGADLDNMLRAMHKGTRHIGKVPGKLPPPVAKTSVINEEVPPPKVSAKKRMAELKSAIERAVAEERYEDAARLRDEVREMETKK